MLSLYTRHSLIDRDHNTLGISAQCQILGLSRSSFYYLLNIPTHVDHLFRRILTTDSDDVDHL